MIGMAHYSARNQIKLEIGMLEPTINDGRGICDGVSLKRWPYMLNIFDVHILRSFVIFSMKRHVMYHPRDISATPPSPNSFRTDPFEGYQIPTPSHSTIQDSLLAVISSQQCITVNDVGA
jgi:hypothetical protein